MPMLGDLSFSSLTALPHRHLEAQVSGGMMKLVDEKKALMEMSALKKTRKVRSSHPLLCSPLF